ncbi:BetI family transcriptional regulator [Chania multitudinisentens RB-25]|uniref:HTH-type transcriptional regulator BetI n=1 Tax=Chania multitudinisentens RB-25 TaxID=1441930 RepID=W0LKG2_9GAMM|nr:transcriptional regulator BetI [Chania multitudinisentens]AHG22465.1 BetI family transcriptional regulator [Chania multitudinisentens RB-25]
MYRKNIPEQRKEQLINAACAAIGDVGLAGVTISQVASLAGMSSGLVSHYFGDKDAFLNATMRKVLCDLHDAIAECRKNADASVKAQLFAIIDGNFHPSQTNPLSMRIWLDFWAASMHQPALCRLQRVNNQRLFSNICFQFQRNMPKEQARKAARGLAAMIDGLWLRGSLTGTDFNADKASEIAYDYVERVLLSDT